MHRLTFLLLLLLLTLFVVQIDTRKVTQKTKAAPRADRSWARSMIDSAKRKYSSGKEKLKSAKEKMGFGRPKSALSDVPRTTKKSFLERAKEKIKEKNLVNKGVAFVKKDLGIGVDGPRKPSKILRYGKKAVEKLFRKSDKTQNVPIRTPSSISSFSQFRPKVQYLQNHLSSVQTAAQESWNTSEAGTKYKFFEEKKTWDDAQLLCEEFGSHLAYLDSESKNAFATRLLSSLPHNSTMLAWFGLRTEIGAPSSDTVDAFNNFANLDGCGVIDSAGSWSISSCSLELPFICQALRLNVLVEIAPAGERLD